MGRRKGEERKVGSEREREDSGGMWGEGKEGGRVRERRGSVKGRR